MHGPSGLDRLALWLLQRKPDEWRRRYATPSSGGCAYSVTLSLDKEKNTELKATSPSVFLVVRTNDNEHPDVDSKGDDAGVQETYARRASVEIDALFDDAIGGRSCEAHWKQFLCPALALVKSVANKADLTLKQGRERGDQNVNKHADLVAWSRR